MAIRLSSDGSQNPAMMTTKELMGQNSATAP